MKRPEPVLLFGIAVAVLEVLNESADAVNLLPAQVFPWVRLMLTLAVAVGGAVWTRSRVTPVADPRDDEGRVLAPVPPPSRLR